MNNDKILVAGLVSFSSLLAACTTPVGGTWPQQGVAEIRLANEPAEITESDDLRIAIEPLKTTVELGEPVYLALSVTNVSDRARDIVGHLQPGEGLVEIDVRDSEGRSVGFEPLGESDFDESTRRSLAPDDVVGDIVPVFFGDGGWTFVEPGEYHMTAKLLAPDGERGFIAYISDDTMLAVTESAAGRRILEGEDQTREEAGKFLLWRSGDHLALGQAQIAEVAEQFPDTNLATYAQAAFAHRWSEPFADYQRGEVRPADCARAATFQSRVDRSLLPENLLIEGAISAARCSVADGDKAYADEMLAGAASLSEGRPELAHLAQRIQTMQKNMAQIPE